MPKIEALMQFYFIKWDFVSRAKFTKFEAFLLSGLVVKVKLCACISL